MGVDSLRCRSLCADASWRGRLRALGSVFRRSVGGDVRRPVAGPLLGIRGLGVDLPKNVPKFFLQRVEGWVSGNDTAHEVPLRGAVGKSGPDRIFGNVVNQVQKRSAHPLVFPQDMVIGLGLETKRLEEFFCMGPEEGHARVLVGGFFQPHPKQMDVVGHQAINGTQQVLPRRDMQKEFAKFPVEAVVQPACRSIEGWKSPMNNCPPAVERRVKPGQVTRDGHGGKINVRGKGRQYASMHRLPVFGVIIDASLRRRLRGRRPLCVGDDVRSPSQHS